LENIIYLFRHNKNVTDSRRGRTEWRTNTAHDGISRSHAGIARQQTLVKHRPTSSNYIFKKYSSMGLRPLIRRLIYIHLYSPYNDGHYGQRTVQSWSVRKLYAYMSAYAEI